jgi:HlyD family secretion protein
MNVPSMRERRPRRLALAVGAVAAGVLVLGLLMVRNTVASVAPVVVVKPALDALPTTIFADGTLSYRNELALTSEVLGAVEEIYVRQGDEVKRGQALMKLRSQQYEAQLAQREAGRDGEMASLEVKRASRELAAAKLRRFTALRKQQLVSEEGLDEAEAAYRQADAAYREGHARIQNQRALVDEVQDSLHKSILRSPIDGTVLSIDVSAGETAVPSALSFSGSTVARIADTRVLVATAKLGEYDVWKIRPGATAQVVVPAFDETPLPGTVRSVSMAPARPATGELRSADRDPQHPPRQPAHRHDLPGRVPQPQGRAGVDRADRGVARRPGRVGWRRGAGRQRRGVGGARRRRQPAPGAPGRRQRDPPGNPRRARRRRPGGGAGDRPAVLETGHPGAGDLV